MARKDPEATKEYNRQRAARLYAEYLNRREALFEKFGGACYLCGKPAVKGFHLHHIEYHPTESDYRRSGRSLSVRIKRVTEAENSPERFRLLCGGCHGLLSIVHARFSGVDLEKLTELIVPPVGL